MLLEWSPQYERTTKKVTKSPGLFRSTAASLRTRSQQDLDQIMLLLSYVPSDDMYDLVIQMRLPSRPTRRRAIIFEEFL